MSKGLRGGTRYVKGSSKLCRTYFVLKARADSPLTNLTPNWLNCFVPTSANTTEGEGESCVFSDDKELTIASCCTVS